MMKKLLLAVAALGCMSLGATSANAAKTFNLNGVKFTDGTAITGSFTTNDAFSSILSYNIMGGNLFNQNYLPSNGFASISSSALTFTATGIIFDQVLQLNLSQALSANGASVTGGSESFFIIGQSVARGGTVSLASGAVPEPASWAMMILGLGAVGFAMRRRDSGKVTTAVRFA